MRLPAFVALAGLLVAYAFWVYFRAELPVRSRVRLALLRAGALVLLLALLFDLRAAWGGGAAKPRRWVLLDVSASMGAGGGAAWDEARARARVLEEEGWTVVPFGDAVGRPDADSVSAPDDLRSELGPAVTRAMEAGVTELTVLSDLRFQDPLSGAAALAAAPLSVAFESFGGPVVNAGISTFRVEDQGKRGEPVFAEVEYFAEGAADSLQLEIREEETLVASVAVRAPSPGRRGRTRVELPAARGEGRLRYSVHAVLPGDGFPADDRGAAYMNAGHEAGGLVVISLTPDWEPRALFTVLEEATGLPATGYLRAGPDRFVPMGRAVQRGAPVDSATVRRAAGDAALLVLHGLGASNDAWGRSLVRRGGRVLLWPVDAVGADLARVPAGGPLPGEWYAAPEIPASALAADLAGARLQDLPPLSGLLPLDPSVQGPAPLLVQLGGTGPGRSALYLDDRDGARRATALASGFWRWAAREGPAKEAYRRLWSGVAGWLLAQDPRSAAARLRPEGWVVPADEGISWWVPGEEGDSVRIQVEDALGEAVLDTFVAGGRNATTPPLPTGTYRFQGTAGDEDVGEGRFDVESRSEEMLPPPADPAAFVAAGAFTAPGGGGHPLRTGPWPYLVLLVLLSAEWVGRRRAGLR